jgi:GTPase SAR1 family protein
MSATARRCHRLLPNSSWLAFARFRCTCGPPLTIGIAGPWGAGKTSLMRMIRENLDPTGDAGGERVKIRLRGGGARLSNRDILRRAGTDGTAAIPPATAADAGHGWRPTVWFNLWMYQSGEQLWARLAQGIIKQVTARLTVADRERFWLELNLRRVDTDDVRRRWRHHVRRRGSPAPGDVFGVAVGASSPPDCSVAHSSEGCW